MIKQLNLRIRQPFEITDLSCADETCRQQHDSIDQKCSFKKLTPCQNERRRQRIDQYHMTCTAIQQMMRRKKKMKGFEGRKINGRVSTCSSTSSILFGLIFLCSFCCFHRILVDTRFRNHLPASQPDTIDSSYCCNSFDWSSFDVERGCAVKSGWGQLGAFRFPLIASVHAFGVFRQTARCNKSCLSQKLNSCGVGMGNGNGFGQLRPFGCDDMTPRLVRLPPTLLLHRNALSSKSFNRGARGYSPCREASFLICRPAVKDGVVESEMTSLDSPILINGSSHSNGYHAPDSTLQAIYNGKNLSSSSEHLILEDNFTLNTNGVQIEEELSEKIESSEADIPLPTANGGYSHTSSSKAKISAANKGKTPWNKGKSRSDEVKARIAEGVRRRNRERFLAKLAEEGITEEEYEARKKEERRKKDAERRARRTKNGGYTPTEETKKKISHILKTKYASGELKRKPRPPGSIRRGFQHTEETKQKIRESLRRKWAEDTEYREMMTNKTIVSQSVSSDSVRQRIAETLKKKWQDPEFRATMLEKFKKRKTSSGSRNEEHRKKISAAMKKKWMDEEYRKRATAGMVKGRESAAPKVRAVKPRMPTKNLNNVNGLSVTLTAAGAVKKAKTSSKKTKRKKSPAKKKKSIAVNPVVAKMEPLSPSSSSATTSETLAAKKEELELTEDGSISRLREERRDLYDLLYGDDDDIDGDAASAPSPLNAVGPNGNSLGESGEELNGVKPRKSTDGNGSRQYTQTKSLASLLDDDGDLDDFDPYGLDNF